MKYIIILAAFLTGTHAQAQVLDRIERKVKNRVDRKIDKTIDKGLDKAEKGIDDATKTKPKSQGGGSAANGNGGSGTGPSASPSTGAAAYTKFDFIPGDKVLFTDDFSTDNTGDFPARWITNGAGEVVSGTGAKYFQLKGGAVYVPVISKALPQDYTVEFDLKTNNLTRKVSSTAALRIWLDDNNKFKPGRSRAKSEIFFCQYNPVGLKVQSLENGSETLSNTIKEDYRNLITEGCRVSVAVNKNRYRLWLNEKKMLDLPTFVPSGARYLKIELIGFDEDHRIMQTYISDVKVAAGGSDLRKKLITEGKFSTTGILFDVNSDRIKPQSLGLIREIAQALQESPAVKVRITGHTDSDGNAAANLELSKRRAQAVKEALVKTYNIGENRLSTDGKGAAQPVADNQTPEGKSQNRRVDFDKTST
jgi:outer membrane protein OmpA-like peptidoglycan-associated protein